jgi:hypothetical protein
LHNILIAQDVVLAAALGLKFRTSTPYDTMEIWIQVGSDFTLQQLKANESMQLTNPCVRELSQQPFMQSIAEFFDRRIFST